MIDSHQHFWQYDKIKDAWITDDMSVIQRSFMPNDLEPVLKENGMEGCVAVQADQSETETEFLLTLAQKHDFIKGVVGWINFCGADIEERLAHFSSYDKLKGFRHIVQSEPEDDFLLRDDFCNGISKLKQFGYTYDILVYPKHLPYALTFVKQFPNQPFVIDHIAKPDIKNGDFDTWKNQMQNIAHFSNVYCKISGLVTEHGLKNWEISDFKPYIDTIMECFGIDRVMFGSDWPVCLLGATYKQCCDILEENTQQLTSLEKQKLWGLNAKKFYSL